jgi:hypothetical protein
MLHDVFKKAELDIFNFSQCLCKCYHDVFKKAELYPLLTMFMPMLHDVFNRRELDISTSHNVYVNVT